MLRVRDLGVEVGGRLVVESATFTVMPRDKVGLVGRNGAGKTSLLRTLGGELEPAGGRVERPADFGYLPQDPRIVDGPRGAHARDPRVVGAWHRRRARAHREVAHRDGGAARRAQRRALHEG
ncbi:MAG: ATP-binding cassette domain-containing protein [Ilumatobacteraceae bacterium]